MKSYTFLLIFVVGASAIRVHSGHSTRRPEKYYSTDLRVDNDRDYSPSYGGYSHGYAYPRTDPSMIDTGVVRPCQGELGCIMSMIMKYGNCKPPLGKIPDPIVLKQLRIRLPHIDMSVISNDLEFKGTSHVIIKDIYFNKITSNLVVVAYFDRMVLRSPHAVLRFQRIDKEPIELQDFYNVVFDSVTLTTTVPVKGNSIRWSRSETSTHFGGPINLTLGSKIMNSSHPTVKEALKKLFEDLRRSAQEAWVTQSAIVMGTIIQSILCDVGENIQYGSYNLESLVFGNN